jgi:hypothetical protein
MYVSRESDCALEGYQWCGGLCFIFAAISEGNCPPQIPRPVSFCCTVRIGCAIQKDNLYVMAILQSGLSKHLFESRKASDVKMVIEVMIREGMCCNDRP